MCKKISLFAAPLQFLFPSLLSSELCAEAAAVAELQHADGGGGWPQQQLHLKAQRHAGPRQRRDQQGAVTLSRPVHINYPQYPCGGGGRVS